MSKRKVKQVKTATYTSAMQDLAELIPTIAELAIKARKDGDKIAMWAMNMIYEDLVKTHVRLGNIRLTIKGDQS